jgi:hypothetical protein
MLEFFKNLFRKEAEKADVKLAELGSWIDGKKKQYDADINSYISSKIQNLEAIKKEILRGIAELEKAEYEDKEKVAPKIRNVVEGARVNYIRQLEHLVRAIKLDNEDKDSVLNSCKLAQQELDVFAQKSAKSYFTTQHLFHKQVEALAEHLKGLGKLVKEMNNSVITSKAFKIEGIKLLITKLQKDSELLKEWSQASKKLERQSSEKEEQIKDCEKEIDMLTKVKEYKEYLEDIEKMKDVRQELNSKSNAIFEILAPLQTALKKYERIAMDNISTIKKYIDKPVETFIEDKNLLLLEVLDKMKSSLEKESIDLKDKKKEKTIKQISQLTKDEAERLRDDYISAERQIEWLKDKIEKNDVQLRQEEMLKKKDKIKDELANAERQIKETESLINKIDIEKDKKEIINKIRETLNIEVNIK